VERILGFDAMDLSRTALVVVDVQEGFRDVDYWAHGHGRDNPACEANVGRLIAAWREAGRPLVFVRHDSDEPGSPLAPGTPGHAFQEVVTGEPDLLVAKQVHSAFHGSPDLDAWLRARSLDSIAICGITTSHCCETTARVGGDLGYDVWFVLDATHGFDRPAAPGAGAGVVRAADIARATAASLHGEFATVVSTDDLLAYAD
jgi:nicotinamidase-related amidase